MTDAIRLRVNDDRAAEKVTYTGLVGERRQLWRQVGWLGFSGQVYNLDREPSEIEPAGWSPLWVLIEDEKTPMLIEDGQ